MQKKLAAVIAGLLIVICALAAGLASLNQVHQEDLTAIASLQAHIAAHDPFRLDSYDYITYPNGTTVFIGSHNANKTTQCLSWLGNVTLGFSGLVNYNAHDIYVGWGNYTGTFSSATSPTSVTHQSDIFNNSAGQGNGFGIKTLTISNVTWWGSGNPGCFNLTAKAYALENLPKIAKTYLLFGTSVYNDFLAGDVCYQVGIPFPISSGGSLTTVWVIQFS